MFKKYAWQTNVDNNPEPWVACTNQKRYMPTNREAWRHKTGYIYIYLKKSSLCNRIRLKQTFKANVRCDGLCNTPQHDDASYRLMSVRKNEKNRQKPILTETIRAIRLIEEVFHTLHTSSMFHVINLCALVCDLLNLSLWEYNASALHCICDPVFQYDSCFLTGFRTSM